MMILLIMPTTASFARLWMSWWGEGGNGERSVGRKKGKILVWKEGREGMKKRKRKEGRYDTEVGSKRRKVV